MNFKYILILLLLILMPIVYAGVSLDTIKVYVNNERASGVDEGGGDIDVKPDDIIDMVVTLDNTENTTSQARLKLTIDNIDNGDDIIKEQDWYDISAKDDKSKTLSFAIPDDTRTDDYDMDLEIFYKLSNGSEYELDKVDFDVIVRRVKEEEKELNVYEALYNLTGVCNSIAETTETCFGYIGKSDNCSAELSTVKEERGTYKTKWDDCAGTLDTCKTDKTVFENEKNALNTQIENMVTIQQCNNQTAFAVNRTKNEGDSKYNQTLTIAGLIALGFWYQQKKKKEKSSVASSYQSDYYKG